VGLYPFQWAAQSVGGDDVVVVSLTQPGADPHDAELSATQVKQLANADLVVFLPGMQAATDKAIVNTVPKRLLNVADVVQLSALPGTKQVGAVGDPSSGLDPHVWLDPARMVAIVSALSQELAQVDPAHAAGYSSRAATVIADLQRLDTEYATGLAQCEIVTFVPSHAAFGYLAQRYGLIQVPISGLAPDIEPSPARLANVRRIAQETSVNTIFFETLSSPALAETLADDLGLLTSVLDPIEGITDASAASDYLGVMRANLQALREANNCR
jgi:zinc transport system substrate-binding protein